MSLRLRARSWFRLGLGLVLGLLVATRGASQTPATPHPAPGADSLRQATPGATTPPTSAPTQKRYQLLENRLTPRAPFNAAANKVRIVAFLSPSCPRCLKNAGELQREVLQKNTTRDVAVIFIWLKVLDKDDEAAAAAAAERFTDPRITHYWDPARVLNAQLLDAVTFDVNLRLYDVFLLYDKKSVWEKRLPRPGYWMHEYKGMTGPWWNVTAFAAEIEKGLRGAPFTSPID